MHEHITLLLETRAPLTLLPTSPSPRNYNAGGMQGCYLCCSIALGRRRGHVVLGGKSRTQVANSLGELEKLGSLRILPLGAGVGRKAGQSAFSVLDDLLCLTTEVHTLHYSETKKASK